MHKWYEDPACNDAVVIGGQVCLVRNIATYFFESKLAPEQQAALAREVGIALHAEESRLGIYFEFHDLAGLDNRGRSGLVGSLALPPMMLGKSEHPVLMTSSDESVSILINGIEHICIQVSCAGRHIHEAYDEAMRIDDAINYHLPYAFSNRYGYLTASPLYTGTGMTASYLLHLPSLVRGQTIERYSKELGRVGFTLRGHFHGNRKAPADVYRVKNSKTLGMSETEILTALENLTGRICVQEDHTWMGSSEKKKAAQIDQMFRAYGLLRYARDLGYDETLEYLSCVRSGYRYGIWEGESQPDTFAMMIGIQDAMLAPGPEQEGEVQAGVRRADYIRSVLPEILENEE